MKKTGYHETHLAGRKLHPETLMVGYGYSSQLSEGAVKPPVYLSSTYVFETAEHGKEFFDMVAGRKAPEPGKSAGLVYSRFNHPNSEIAEDRLAIYEGADSAALFATGMAAISTSMLAFVRPGDVVVHSQPLYGGTDVFFQKTLSQFGVSCVGFFNGVDAESIRRAMETARSKGRVPVIYVETPSNPLNTMVDLALVASLREEIFRDYACKPLIFCDNTLLGPVYQKPLEHGADLSLYSVTKYIGGHSDLVAGAVVGPSAVVTPIKQLRGAMGTSLDPHTSWMIGRSLETLGLRMRAACDSAQHVARFLKDHPKVETVFFPEFLSPSDPAHAVFKTQCGSSGSTFSFHLKTTDRAQAFAFLNDLRLFKLAVSLGGTESLACHPATTVHSGVLEETRLRMGITESTIRLSVGIENTQDLIEDLRCALEKVSA